MAEPPTIQRTVDSNADRSFDRSFKSPHARLLRLGASGSLIALIVFCLAWEFWLAPLRPGGSLLALKIVPLLFPLRGVLRGRLYTMQWAAMLVLLYFAEGLVRATSDPGALAWLGWIEAVLALVFFVCAVAYVRPHKRAARQQAVQQAQAENSTQDPAQLAAQCAHPVADQATRPTAESTIPTTGNQP